MSHGIRAIWPTLTEEDARNPSRLGHGFLGLTQGHMNVVLDVDLAAGTTTVIDNSLVLEQSAIIAVPVNAAAAALVATGPVWSDETTQVDGQCTLTHPTAVGGEEFRVVVLG